MVEVKKFDGKPTVFVVSTPAGVQVTTDEHLRNENRPLKVILEEICQQAKEYAKSIFDKYDYPNGEWFPCGSADVVLTWNDTKNREVIQLFKKEAASHDGDFYRGWFGRLFKTGQGWWWFPELEQDSQALKYEEEVCRFIRDQLAKANIRVTIRTYID